MGEIRTVNETLEELLAAETEQDVCDAVVDGARRFNPEAFVVVSTLLPDGDSVRAGPAGLAAAWPGRLGTDEKEMQHAGQDSSRCSSGSTAERATRAVRDRPCHRPKRVVPWSGSRIDAAA